MYEYENADEYSLNFNISFILRINVVSIEAFTGTEFNEILLGRQPHQDVKVFRRFEQ